MTTAQRQAAIRILLVEDHTVVREGMRRLLDAEGDLAVVGQAADADQALDRAEQLRPDVVVLDLRLGKKASGLAAAQQIVQHLPRVAILVLTGLEDPEYAQAALDAGARGYLLKTASAADIAASVRRVHAGERVLDASVAAALGNDRRRTRRDRLAELSDRECEVFRLLARGLRNAEIAETLDISVRTAEGHVEHVLQKLDLPSRAAAIAYAMRTRFPDRDGLTTPR
jgi:DNA-binding NarL/FixJ family response regulator